MTADRERWIKGPQITQIVDARDLWMARTCGVYTRNCERVTRVRELTRI
jgi:hypothetical protein